MSLLYRLRCRLQVYRCEFAVEALVRLAQRRRHHAGRAREGGVRGRATELLEDAVALEYAADIIREESHGWLAQSRGERGPT